MYNALCNVAQIMRYDVLIDRLDKSIVNITLNMGNMNAWCNNIVECLLRFAVSEHMLMENDEVEKKGKNN